MPKDRKANPTRELLSPSLPRSGILLLGRRLPRRRNLPPMKAEGPNLWSTSVVLETCSVEGFIQHLHAGCTSIFHAVWNVYTASGGTVTSLAGTGALFQGVLERISLKP